MSRISVLCQLKVVFESVRWLFVSRVQSLKFNSLVNTVMCLAESGSSAFDALWKPHTMIIVYIMALNAPLWSWKEHCIFFLPLNASRSQCALWFMSSVPNAGSSSCLGVDIHPLIATFCPCVCVAVCVLLPSVCACVCVRRDKIWAGLL